MALSDLDTPLLGAFLDHLEQKRDNSARTRNVRLAAIHSFFRHVALHAPEYSGLAQRVLAMPSKRYVRISRKEGQRFTACRSTVSHQVGPVLVRQDVVDFHSVTYAGQALDGYPRARARAH